MESNKKRVMLYIFVFFICWLPGKIEVRLQLSGPTLPLVVIASSFGKQGIVWWENYACHRMSKYMYIRLFGMKETKGIVKRRKLFTFLCSTFN